MSSTFPMTQPKSESTEADRAVLAAAYAGNGPAAFAVPGALGFLLWAVVCWSPAELELASPGSRFTVLAAYFLPLVALVAGLAARSASGTIVGVAITLGLSFSVIGPLDMRPLNSPAGAATLTGTFLAFVIGTVRYGPSREPRPTVRAEAGRAYNDPSALTHKIYTWPRVILLLALFIVPLTALYGVDGQAAVAENFADRELEATILIHTVHLFVSVLVAYLFFLSPAINMPLEINELRGELNELGNPKNEPTYRRNLVLYLLFGLALVGLFALLRMVR